MQVNIKTQGLQGYGWGLHALAELPWPPLRHLPQPQSSTSATVLSPLELNAGIDSFCI